MTFHPILALDPATHCGWAMSSLHSGVWDLSVKRDMSVGMKLLMLENYLEDAHSIGGFKMIAFEAARNTSIGGAVVSQAELQGLIKSWCLKKGVEYIGYSPSEIKKHATGKGNANKGAMVNAAKEKYPNIKIMDDNHADALHILSYAMSNFPHLYNE